MAYSPGSNQYVQNAAGVWTPVGFAAGNASVPVLSQGDPDTVASGSITTTDLVVGAHTGNGALLSGTSTVNSYVFLACPGGDSAWDVQLTGTFGSGTVWFEESMDSTNGVDGNWIAVNGRQTGVVNTVLTTGATVAGMYRGNTSGVKYLRLRITGATAPNVAVTIRMSSGVGAIFLNASIPAGSNNIGGIQHVGPTGGTTNTARVTTAGEQYVTDSLRLKQAVGIAHSGRLTVGAAADAATAGRFWLINPVGSAVLIEVRRVEFSSAPIAATAFPSSPRVTVERVTFTGTPTGAVITPVVRDTTETALVGSVRTASTGLVLTAGALAYGFTVAPILTAVGAAVPALQEWEPAENGRIVLRAGQGIVVRQADAGTTADTRSFQVNFAWAEYTVPS